MGYFFPNHKWKVHNFFSKFILFKVTNNDTPTSTIPRFHCIHCIIQYVYVYVKENKNLNDYENQRKNRPGRISLV